MLYYALIFLIVALIAGAVGFFALAGIAALIAKVLFFLFLVIFLISLIGRGRRTGPRVYTTRVRRQKIRNRRPPLPVPLLPERTGSGGGHA